ncbi:CLUMA_CG013019, isoform A [Clunio marinus]|uniref:CLUMA_CG013019, isoform A n=1 Tax=Clunio marinus TaxID=568069 RepID=A0A1J1IHR7_9DIPT|nr:CLUMA_CG013019, isoform A [Clunio marinus]
MNNHFNQMFNSDFNGYYNRNSFQNSNFNSSPQQFRGLKRNNNMSVGQGESFREQQYQSREFINSPPPKRPFHFKHQYDAPQSHDPNNFRRKVTNNKNSNTRNKRKVSNVGNQVNNNNNNLQVQEVFRENFSSIQEQKDREWTERFDHTMKLLEKCNPGNEIDLISSYLQPSRETFFRMKEEIQHDLSRILSSLELEDIYVFGSTLTGLDFTGSDLDFYIKLRNPPSSELETKQILTRTAKLIYSSNVTEKTFRVVCTIHKTRVPLVRLLHTATNIMCDINFSSVFGYYNSLFISYILSYDNRIKNLAIILKLWSKCHQVAKRMILSNYCLLNLMIFYLQNIPSPILDTIANNQDSKAPKIINQKWNFFFNDQIYIGQGNDKTLRDLLVGFFDFYSNVDYGNLAVCLHSGRLIQKSIILSSLQDFSQQNDANPQTMRTDPSLCFKNEKNVEFFFKLIKTSHNKCIQLQEKPFSELLLTLFNDFEGISKKNVAKPQKKFQMTVHAVASHLKICEAILRAKCESDLCSDEEQRKLFFNNVVNYTKKLLADFYLCTITDDKNLAQDEMKTNYRVVLKEDTVNGRKKMNFKDDKSANTEIELSKKIRDNKNKFDLDAVVEISSVNQGQSVDISMTENQTKKSSIANFGNFFSINLTEAIKYFLKKDLEVLTVKKEEKGNS